MNPSSWLDSPIFSHDKKLVLFKEKIRNSSTWTLIN